MTVMALRSLAVGKLPDTTARKTTGLRSMP